MNIYLWEVDFEDGYSICIKSKKTPCVKSEDMIGYLNGNSLMRKDISKFGKIVNVYPISKEDAEKFYDMKEFSNWPIL